MRPASSRARPAQPTISHRLLTNRLSSPVRPLPARRGDVVGDSSSSMRSSKSLFFLSARSLRPELMPSVSHQSSAARPCPHHVLGQTLAYRCALPDRSCCPSCSSVERRCPARPSPSRPLARRRSRALISGAGPSSASNHTTALRMGPEDYTGCCAVSLPPPRVAAPSVLETHAALLAMLFIEARNAPR